MGVFQIIAIAGKLVLADLVLLFFIILAAMGKIARIWLVPLIIFFVIAVAITAAAVIFAPELGELSTGVSVLSAAGLIS